LHKLDIEREMVMVTLIGGQGMPTGVTDRKKLFWPGGAVGKLRPPWLEEEAAKLAEACLASGTFAMASVAGPQGSGQTAQLMVDILLPLPELIILGAGHIALPLAKLGSMLGYRVVVIDDRPEFASAKRFPDASRIICCSFSDILQHIQPSPRSSVVIITRGHQHDQECLEKLVNFRVAYLGQIGSGRRVAILRNYLLEQGFDRRRLDEIHMPIGLDIGAQTPEEIAVSIAAELVNVRQKGRGRSMSGVAEAEPTPEIPEPASAENLAVLKLLVEGVHHGTPAALATIVATTGSAPRKAGAKLLVFADGHTAGTVGGGCGEAQIRRAALNVIHSGQQLVHLVSMNDEETVEEGMVCGGTMEVFIEPIAMFQQVLGG
jgi:xanthine dehydrogenase accessory factor